MDRLPGERSELIFDRSVRSPKAYVKGNPNSHVSRCWPYIKQGVPLHDVFTTVFQKHMKLSSIKPYEFEAYHHKNTHL